ncbi:MAG: copper chaperone Copz family protein [Gammaproteobacteria bacterium]|nr:copper chaperone Copz family protein [Gammaproteobacteria bacterium]
MSDCCSSGSACATAGRTTRKQACPSDQSMCAEVSRETMLHHLAAPWAVSLTAEKYYFCSSPDCDVVYFGDDGSVITVDAIRSPVGQKQNGADKVLCYCFGVTQADYDNNPEVKQFVVQQTKESSCACETRNPSGRCCLKDFPKTQKFA